ncbi:MAG TPA: TIM barrel protein, partial [Armatimonadota bacterium]|nr:TIM barrel protein [Armatimonadota bacterium]
MRIGFIARPTAEDFEFAALKGFPCVELNLFDDLALLERAGEVRTWRQKYGIDLSAVGLFGRNYLADDAAEREQHLQALRRVAEFAAAVGAPVLTTGGGRNDALSPEQRLQRTLDLLGPVLQHAAGLGLR